MTRLQLVAFLAAWPGTGVESRRNLESQSPSYEGLEPHEAFEVAHASSFLSLRAGATAASAAARVRQQAWHRKGLEAHGEQPTPAKASKVCAALNQKAQRHIFFERDAAGFNNVRLQLESMVALAAVTGRTLVLPPPTQHDHIKDPYFEFDIFSAANLTKMVSVDVNKTADDKVQKVTQLLGDVELSSLDKERDWFFPAQQSRIQHFECLKLSDEKDRAVAANAVLHGVVFDQKYEQQATKDLEKLGLSSGEKEKAGFNCAHIRRGDFKKFAPQYWMEDGKLSTKLKGMFGEAGRPVLLASDERPELDLGTKVLHTSDAYEKSDSDQTRLLVDMVMCSRADDFVGSPMSTFSNGILELRRRNAVLKGTAPSSREPPTRLYAGEPEFTGTGMCWNKQTTFEAVKACEKDSSPSCFAACHMK